MSEDIRENSGKENDNQWLDSCALLAIMMAFGGLWGSSDTKDHELRERVAKLEGQMDMIRR